MPFATRSWRVPDSGTRRSKSTLSTGACARSSFIGRLEARAAVQQCHVSLAGSLLPQGSTRAFPPHHPLIPVDYQFTGQPVMIGGTMARREVAFRIGTAG